LTQRYDRVRGFRQDVVWLLLAATVIAAVSFWFVEPRADASPTLSRVAETQHLAHRRRAQCGKDSVTVRNRVRACRKERDRPMRRSAASRRTTTGSAAPRRPLRAAAESGAIDRPTLATEVREPSPAPPSGVSSEESSGRSQPAESPPQPAESPRFFSPTSFWNAPLPSDAALDESSSAVIGAFDEEVALEEKSRTGPWINTTSWSVPVYTVSASQPTVEVQIVGTWPEPALQSAWSAVPLPANAMPAQGKDRHLVVWQPSTDRMWEFWHLVHSATGWTAAWGGAMDDVSSNPGVYGPEAWSGSQPWWGATASSLPLVGGLITLGDLRSGHIDHALALAIPNVRAGAYTSPAQRDDGTSTAPYALPEGAHLRLSPTLDLSKLHLPPLTMLIAEAAQRYGIIVRDTGGNIAFYAEDPSTTDSEPYAGRGGYFEGEYPEELLATFPWKYLQLLKMELHTNGYGSR
jgi:hypothetical protein